jgi:predicted nuclease with TOPRIM domain
METSWRKAAVSLSSVAAVALVVQKLRSAKKQCHRIGECNGDGYSETAENEHQKRFGKSVLDTNAAVRVEAATGETVEQQSQAPAEIDDFSNRRDSMEEIQNKLQEAVSEEAELRSQLKEMQSKLQDSASEEAELRSELKDAVSEKLDLAGRLQDTLADAIAEGHRTELQLKTELQSAASKESDIQGKLQDALSEEAQLRSHLQDATCQISDFETKLQDSLSEEAQLRSHLQHATCQESDLEGKLQASLSEEAELRSHLQDASCQQLDLQGELQASLSEGDQLRSHLQCAASKESELQTELHHSLSRESKLHDQLRKSGSEEGKLRAQLQRATAKDVEVRTELQEALLKNKLEASLLEEVDVKAAYVATKERVQTYKAKRNSLAADEARLGAEVHAAKEHYQREESHFKRQKSWRQSELVETERSCELLNERLQQLEQDEKELARKTAQRVALLGVHAKAAEDEAASLGTTVLRSESKCQLLQDKLRGVVAEAADLMEKCRDAAVDVDMKRQEFTELSQESANLKGKCRDIGADVEMKRRALTELSEESADLIARRSQAAVGVSEKAEDSDCEVPAISDGHAVLSKMRLFDAVLREAADLAEKRRLDISQQNSYSDFQTLETPRGLLEKLKGGFAQKEQKEDASITGSHHYDTDGDDKSENTDGNLDDADSVTHDVDNETPVENGNLIISSLVVADSSRTLSRSPSKRNRLLEENGAGTLYECEKPPQMSVARARHEHAVAQQTHGEDSVEGMRAAVVLAQQLQETSESLDEAECLLRGAHSGIARKLGEDHLETLHLANSLAVHLDNANNIEEAISLYRKASIGRRANLGADHPHALDSAYNLAQALASSGKMSESEATLREVFAGCMKTFGLEHHGTIDCLEKLVELLHEMRSKAADREQLCRSLVEARISACGLQHPSTLKASVLLIDPILDRDVSEAMKAYQDAMGRYEVALGADDPETFELVSEFAASLTAHGARKEARTILEDALQTCETQYGVDSAAALDYVDDIAIFFANGGDAATAETYFKRAHQTRCRLLGASHEEALRSENNLAMFYDSEGMREGAARAYRSVHAGRVETLGESNFKTAEAAYNLAVFLSAPLRNSNGTSGQRQILDEAVSLLKSALASMEEHLGWTDDRTTNCAEKLAELYKASDRVADAETYFRKVFDVQSSNPSTFATAQVASAAYNLANCLMQSERISEAENLYLQAVTGYEHVSEEDGDPSLDRELYAMDATFNLAVCLQAQGKFDSAVPFFKRAAKGRTRLLGPDHAETMRASAALTQCTLASMSAHISEPDAVRSHDLRYD